jgi:hypothetical protein
MYCPECAALQPCFTDGCSRSLNTPLVRPKSRILAIANELAVAWERAPDLRLGQFLQCLAGDEDVWQIEDLAWLAALKEFRHTGEFS